MKIIRFKHGTPRPNGSVYLAEVIMGWNEANEEIAKKEAYNGEYTIEDDGQPEPVYEPTTDDILNVLLGVASNE